MQPGAISINPLNWKRDETYASVEENLGSLRPDAAGRCVLTDGMADAQIDLERGVVICATGRPFIAQTEFFGPASYHGNDYDFYYVNIQENAGERVKSFLEGGRLYLSTDYSDADNRLRLPQATKPADTIYFYPTSDLDASVGASDHCTVDHAGMRQGAEGVYRQQATAFEASTNVFAPFYRQTNISAFADNYGDSAEAFLMGEERQDVYDALDLDLRVVRNWYQAAVLVVLQILLLAGCGSSAAQKEDESVLRIAEQGMFSAGGTVTAPAPGKYDPAKSWLDDTRAGATSHVDHANVLYQIPEDDNGKPIVYLHGYGQSRISRITLPFAQGARCGAASWCNSAVTLTVCL